MSAQKEAKKLPMEAKTKTASQPSARSRQEQLELEQAAYEALKKAWKRISKEQNDN